MPHNTTPTALKTLKKTLDADLSKVNPAAAWVLRWRGLLRGTDLVPSPGGRLASLQTKHLR